MEKFPVLAKADLDADQRAFWDDLTCGPRGFYTGGPEAARVPELYNAWLQFPEFGQAMTGLGDALRACGELSGRWRELVVLTTSARLGARVEFDFHAPFARSEGLSDAVIAAIGAGDAPPFDDPGDRVVHDATAALLRSARLTPALRKDALHILGHRGLMQLIAAVTLYAATAWTTNVARVELAEDFSADPDELKDFFAGK